MNQKQIENRALLITVIVNAIITGAGIWMYVLTGLQIMFLDGFFSLIALSSTISAVLISKISKNKTRHYPNGLYFLEPLYAVLKAVLMIALMISAVITSFKVAIDYFAKGIGEIMNTSPLPVYSVVMTVLCLGLGFFNLTQYKRTNKTSTILRAESQTNFIDGLQSAGIGVAIVALHFIPLESPLSFLHYTGDFFIALIIVVAAIKEPIDLFFDAMRELTGGITTDSKIIDIVKESTGLKASQFDVYKMGMRIRVCVRLSCAEEFAMHDREKALDNLRVVYENSDIEYIL